MTRQSDTRPPRGRLARALPLLVVAAGLTGAFLLGRPAPAEVTLARIDGIWQKGLYEERFSLARDADVSVEAVGCGAPDAEAMLAYAWILDLGRRTVPWRMESQRSEKGRGRGNLVQRDRVHLPAGDYALYFSAIGGAYPVKKHVKILDLIDIGTVSISGGHYVRWNEQGDPDEWEATVTLAGGEGADVMITPPRTPALHALLRMDKTGNDACRRARLVVAEPVKLRVLAVGEYAAGDLGFADGGWIRDLDTGERVWEMTLVNTLPAGGAPKNRVFDGEIKLAPGRYLACYVTDDSHAFNQWNSQPPYDPDSWGLTLIPEDPPSAAAVEVTLDPPDENVIARIAGVGDSEYRESEFRLTHPARVFIQAFGEWSDKRGRNVDYGWIEDAYSLRKVWSMETDRGRYASGEARNRIVEDVVSLEPGTYRVGYITDFAHSRAGWHSSPPFDPEGWGITVSGLGKDFRMDWVDLDTAGKGARTVIRLAPLRDDVHQRVRFRVDEAISVRLTALGEGERDGMYDYGWLDDESTGRPVWTMEFADTRHAGGASKNRKAETVLTLEPGTYSLNFETDGSHAFGDWNGDPPNDPQLWGITLVELPSGKR